MVRATSSLPVPVSPWINTVLFIGATSSSVENSVCTLWWRPITLSNRKRSWSCALSDAFSSRSRSCSSPVRSTRESCDSWNGLIRKSTAPRRIAVTASSTPPKPVITTARISG